MQSSDPKIPLPRLPGQRFTSANSSRVLGYHWGDVQNLTTGKLRSEVELIGYLPNDALPFKPPGTIKYIGVLVRMPNGDEVWLHQAPDVVRFMGYSL